MLRESSGCDLERNWRALRAKLPNPEASSNIQIFQMCAAVYFEIWSLEFLWNLGFGVWDFAPAGRSRRRKNAFERIPKSRGERSRAVGARDQYRAGRAIKHAARHIAHDVMTQRPSRQ